MKVHPIISSPSPSSPSHEITIETMETVENNNHFQYSLDVKCMFYWETYKRLFLFLFGILIIMIIVMIIILRPTSSSTTSNSPCEKYKQDDMASSVSIECIRYVWANAGCKSSVPDGYNGFWRRSPEGGKTVLCIPPRTDHLCGAGSYSYLINNAFKCNLDYKGY